jgi:O-antigen ligase
MFWVWLVAMSLSQALFNRAVSLPRRTLALGVATLALARGWFYAFSWVSGWLPPVLAAAILLLIRFPRTMLGLGLLSVAPVVAASGRAIDALMVGESYSWMTRLEAFEVISRLLERNPWLGFGPANYYHYTILHPILGWWVRFNSHNTYVDLLAQTGVIGLLVFVWAAFEAARLAVALQSRLPWGFARAYAAGAFAGLVASLAAAWLADWIIPFAYNVGVRGFRSSLLFWFFLGGLLVLRRAVLSTRGRPAETRDFRWEAAS